MIDAAIHFIDWIPDTIWDSVLVMLVLYGTVLVAVFEFMTWLDRRKRREEA